MRVKHFRPSLGSFFMGRLIRGSTYMRVYMVLMKTYIQCVIFCVMVHDLDSYSMTLLHWSWIFSLWLPSFYLWLLSGFSQSSLNLLIRAFCGAYYTFQVCKLLDVVSGASCQCNSVWTVCFHSRNSVVLFLLIRSTTDPTTSSEHCVFFLTEWVTVPDHLHIPTFPDSFRRSIEYHFIHRKYEKY